MAEARSRDTGSVEREADCHRDKACLEEYDKQKSQWLACLDEAGLSEKKRKKLSAKVEGMGIHSLKRQEVFFIFNAKRKECHNNFMKSLANIHIQRETVKDKTSHTSPPPVPDLTEKKDN